MNKNKGISLIALVVTIIVLLIISGVAVSMITGYNGLFGMANSSADKYNQNSLSESQRLQEIYAHLLLADSNGTTLENVDMTTLNTLIEQKVNQILQNERKNTLLFDSATDSNGCIITATGNNASRTFTDAVSNYDFVIVYPGYYNTTTNTLSNDFYYQPIIITKYQYNTTVEGYVTISSTAANNLYSVIIDSVNNKITLSSKNVDPLAIKEVVGIKL